jgi:DNA-binding transcriptional MocR family regulator
MAETIATLHRTASWAERLSYQTPCGLDVDRQAGSAWLNRTVGFESLDWRTLICCSGAQNAMAIALTALCERGDVVLCEAATFSGVKALATQFGYRLHGVGIDTQGAQPESLDRAVAQTGARVFYALPTLQNPTARTMDLKRRAEIVEIVRASSRLASHRSDGAGAHASCQLVVENTLTRTSHGIPRRARRRGIRSVRARHARAHAFASGHQRRHRDGLD